MSMQFHEPDNKPDEDPSDELDFNAKARQARTNTGMDPLTLSRTTNIPEGGVEGDALANAEPVASPQAQNPSAPPETYGAEPPLPPIATAKAAELYGNNDPHYADMPGVDDSSIMHGNPTPYAADMRDEPSGHSHGGDLSVAGGSGGSGGGGSDVLDTTAGPSGPMIPTPSIEDTGSAGSPSNEPDVSAATPHAVDHAPHHALAPGGINEPGPEAQP